MHKTEIQKEWFHNIAPVFERNTMKTIDWTGHQSTTVTITSKNIAGIPTEIRGIIAFKHYKKALLINFHQCIQVVNTLSIIHISCCFSVLTSKSCIFERNPTNEYFM